MYTLPYKDISADTTAVTGIKDPRVCRHLYTVWSNLLILIVNTALRLEQSQVILFHPYLYVFIY